ncbi:MAG: putative Ig domain-containing protein [Jatrophihabitans sp.]
MGLSRRRLRAGPVTTRPGAGRPPGTGGRHSATGHARRATADDGFILLESIISITLITVIMAALGVFFTTTIRTSGHLRRDQTASQVADSAVEQVRAIDPTSVISGRDNASVVSENAAAPATIASNWLATMSLAADTNAPAGAGRVACPSASSCALLPTTAVNQNLNGQLYAVNYYVGNCYRARSNPGTDCTPLGGIGFINYLRVVVVVAWTETGCPSAQCLYVTSTLVSPSPNPIFNLNSTPPPAPSASQPPDQTSAVNDTVSLTLSASSGVPPFTWTATNLPAGLAMNSAGVITGSPTTAGAAKTVTAVVTDAFLRTDTTTFKWTVLPPLTAGQPADQNNTWHSAISNLSLSATGGSGGYSWSDPSHTLPAGLNLTGAGVISGTPSTVGDYPVQLIVKDSGNRTDSVSFDWQVDYPPLTASQSNVSSTVNAATSLNLSASGGSGSYTWSDPSNTLRASGLGLNLTAAGAISGTPTRAGSYSISVLVTDATAGLSKAVTFTWTVVTLPSVISPGAQSGTVGRPVTVALSYNCTATPCTISATGLPSGLSISGGSIVGTLPGSVSGSSDVFAGIQLSIRDANNRTSQAAATFAWTVNAAPTLTITSQVDITGGSVDAIPVTVTNGTGPYTFSISSKPAGVTLTDPSIGELTGTATTTQSLTGIKMTVVDASGYTVKSVAFTWTVKNTVILQSVASTSFCGIAGGSAQTGYYLAAGACSSGIQLTYTSTNLLQVTSSPTLCVKANTSGSIGTTGVNCDSTSTAQQWLFNADNSIVNVATSKCLDLPAGSVSGTAFDLVSCPPVTSRMQWNIQ